MTLTGHHSLYLRLIPLIGKDIRERVAFKICISIAYYLHPVYPAISHVSSLILNPLSVNSHAYRSLTRYTSSYTHHILLPSSIIFSDDLPTCQEKKERLRPQDESAGRVGYHVRTAVSRHALAREAFHCAVYPEA